MPPRRAKNTERTDCDASPSIIHQKSPGNASFTQLESSSSTMNSKAIGSNQRVLRRRPPLPPPSDLDAQQCNGRRTSSRAKVKVESNPEDHHGTGLMLDHEQSTKVSSSIRSSSRRVGHGRPPIAPTQVALSPSVEKTSAKHLVSAQILASEESTFQKETPEQRKSASCMMENSETPVTSAIKKTVGAVRYSTRNTRTHVEDVVKSDPIEFVRSSIRIKKTGLKDEEVLAVSELKKSTAATKKRNSASEKLQTTSTKRAKKDGKANSDKDAEPTLCMPSGTRKGTSNTLETHSAQTDKSTPKDEETSQPVKKRVRRCNSAKSTEPPNEDENKDMHDRAVLKTGDSVKSEELERAEDKVEAVPQPKRRRTTKASAKMIEEKKSSGVLMELTSSKDLQLGEQSLRGSSINQCELGTIARDGKNESPICSTSATKANLLAPNKGKKSTAKKATSRTTTRANKKIDPSSGLVDTVTLASVGEVETSIQSSEVIVISTVTKKVNKRVSSRLTSQPGNKKAASSISLEEGIMPSMKTSEVADNLAPGMMAYNLDAFPMPTNGILELNSQVNHDEIGQLSVKELKQRMSKKTLATNGRKMGTRTPILSKTAEKVSSLPTIVEDEINKEKRSVTRNELSNAQKADTKHNSEMQKSPATDENSNRQDANKKLGKKGVAKKRSLPENIQKTKRLKNSAELVCVSTPDSMHTATKGIINEGMSVAVKNCDWDANDITNSNECAPRNNVIREPGKAQSNRMLAFDALPVGFGLGISGL